ncbi:MAG: 6,7-dimethyl-8-ribityllumazine synthase, partial [Fimbriimonadaceae bacterium]|nr:6,7-dimethyl-8-ribityllumazine synthase [Fimbriimonadaceae bacterium]
KKVGIVVSRWNELVTKALLEGALDELKGIGDPEVIVVWVPGVWEIPLAAKALASRDDVHGVVALGCILQGATTHAGMLAGDVASTLMVLQVESGKPISWGVLTPETQEQAFERAGMKLGNKGREAAGALAEMVNLLPKIAD